MNSEVLLQALPPEGVNLIVFANLWVDEVWENPPMDEAFLTKH